MVQASLFDTDAAARDALWAGVDEAGRGPLAGPVVAAAVILHPDHSLPGLDDSKKLSEKRRESLEKLIRSKALSFSVAWADAAEIDSINVLSATMLAMRRAIMGLAIQPRGVHVDGNRLPDLLFGETLMAGEAIVSGDSKVASISAASILAKTARDRTMRRLHDLYPHYEFAQHKGYGTKLHCERLREHGPCQQHRRSFAPVSAVS